MNEYTKEEIEILTTMYPTYGLAYVATLIARPISSIKSKASELKLKKIQGKDKTCSKTNCLRPVKSMGFCDRHYSEERRAGTFTNKKCSVDSCDNPMLDLKSGVCANHKMQQFRKENPDKDKQYRKTFYDARSPAYIKQQIIKNKEYCQLNRAHLSKLQKERRNSNKEHCNTVSNDRRKNIIRFAIRLYDSKCADCNNTDLACLEWHHIIPTKEQNLELVSRLYKSKNKDSNILLLCANCHIYHNIKDNTNNQGMLNLKAFSYDYLPKTTREKHSLLTRRLALEIYNCKCQVCSNADIVVMQWHHRRHLVPREQARAAILRILKVNKQLDDIMLLCINCHKKQDLIDKTNLRNKAVIQCNTESILC
jgi:hypothetical protein